MKSENNIAFISEILKNEKAAFLINLNRFEENIDLLKHGFLNYYPNINIGYSYKTNYIPLLCRSAHQKGCWAEVVSEMEVEMALKHLDIKSNLIYNGPIKSRESIRKVILAGGLINIDNELDLLYIIDIITEQKYEFNIASLAIRVNFTYNGHDSRFGVELNKIQNLLDIIDSNPKLKLQGYHIHLPFRDLESFSFRVKSITQVLDLHGSRPLKSINIGGGFWGRIDSEFAESLGLQSVPLFTDYGKVIGKELSGYFKNLNRSEWPILFIEPGSSVVADTMSFLSKIHTIKEVNNKKLLVTYAGRHLLVPTNKSILLPVELIQSNHDNRIRKFEECIVVGFTCIESDIIGKSYANFTVKDDDFVLIRNVGSYSVVMGSDFILPQPAIFSIKNGTLSLVRRSKKIQDVLNTFCD